MYPSAILSTLCNTLVTPHLHYCLLCWGSIIKENDLLHIMQKRVLRTITNSNCIAHTETLFKELKLVKSQICMLLQLLLQFGNFIIS